MSLSMPTDKYRRLSRRDFENGAVVDDILSALQERDALKHECARLEALLAECHDLLGEIWAEAEDKIRATRSTHRPALVDIWFWCHDIPSLLDKIKQRINRGNATAQPPDKPGLRDSAGDPKA